MPPVPIEMLKKIMAPAVKYCSTRAGSNLASKGVPKKRPTIAPPQYKETRLAAVLMLRSVTKELVS